MLFGSQCDCRHQLEKTAASYITTLLVLEHLFLPFCKNIKMHSCTLLVEYTFQLSFNHHLCSGGWIAWFGHWQRCHPVSLGRYFRLHLLCLPAIKEYSLDCIWSLSYQGVLLKGEKTRVMDLEQFSTNEHKVKILQDQTIRQKHFFVARIIFCVFKSRSARWSLAVHWGRSKRTWIISVASWKGSSWIKISSCSWRWSFFFASSDNTFTFFFHFQQYFHFLQANLQAKVARKLAGKKRWQSDFNIIYSNWHIKQVLKLHK